MAKASKSTVVRSSAAVKAKTAANPETALYQVLEPFWLNGTTVKPTDADGAPVFIEMDAGEVQAYQDAGVLGTEPAEVPTADTP